MSHTKGVPDFVQQDRLLQRISYGVRAGAADFDYRTNLKAGGVGKAIRKPSNLIRDLSNLYGITSAGRRIENLRTVMTGISVVIPGGKGA
jgi:hypothetical protein